jgi:hypothetical protein
LTLSLFCSFVSSEVSYPEPEFKAWLQTNEEVALLKVRSFRGSHAARLLADRLYSAGAVYIGVVIVLKEVSGLRVYLPQSFKKREEIFKIANRELEGNGFSGEEDTGQDALMVWLKR